MLHKLWLTKQTRLVKNLQEKFRAQTPNINLIGSN